MDSQSDSKSLSSSSIITIAASVPTGLEPFSLEEIEEKICNTEFKTNAWTTRGRVYFDINKDNLKSIHQLRTVDNLFLLVNEFKDYKYNADKETAIADLKKLAKKVDWKHIENIWKLNAPHQKSKVKVKENKESTSVNESPNKSSPISNNEIRFRTTGNRVGKAQSITSCDAEWHFGGAMQDETQWKVDLTGYNLEIFINLGVDMVQVFLGLTLQSLHRRNIVQFGHTTLRATTASCMLRMCHPKPGDVILDPMCGTAAIPVEGCVSMNYVYLLGGDLYKVPLLKSKQNLASNKIEENHLKGDFIKWDVTNLPLKTNSVDVVVTDLPFGKRVGTKADNRVLYPKMVEELARICKNKTGKACLLTNDKHTMKNALLKYNSLWSLQKLSMINIGGLKAGVFYIKRTTE